MFSSGFRGGCVRPAPRSAECARGAHAHADRFLTCCADAVPVRFHPSLRTCRSYPAQLPERRKLRPSPSRSPPQAGTQCHRNRIHSFTGATEGCFVPDKKPRKAVQQSSASCDSNQQSTAQSRLGACVISGWSASRFRRGAGGRLAGALPPRTLGLEEQLQEDAFGSRATLSRRALRAGAAVCRALGPVLSVGGRPRSAGSHLRCAGGRPAPSAGHGRGARPSSREGPRRYVLKALACQVCIIRCSVSLL